MTTKIVSVPAREIQGLIHLENAISETTQYNVLHSIINNPGTEVERCDRLVYHYGTQTQSLGHSCQKMTVRNAPPIPSWCRRLYKDVLWRRLVTKIPNQANIYVYPSGVGIAPHWDSNLDFESEIIMFSLYGTTSMTFERKFSITDPDYHLIQTSRLFLRPGSLVLLKGPARYEWKHGIPKVTFDYDVKTDQQIPRQPLRISVVFRTLPRLSLFWASYPQRQVWCRMCGQSYYIFERDLQRRFTPFFCDVCCYFSRGMDSQRTWIPKSITIRLTTAVMSALFLHS